MPRHERVEVPAPGTNRKVPVYGALNHRTNRVSYRIGDGKNATEFVGFLAQLVQEYGDRSCVLVLDNASYHTARLVRSYLEELAASIEVIWLPPYCPELNDIERIWKYVKGASLANYDFGEVESLREAIRQVFDDLNSRASDDLSLCFRDALSKQLLKVA